MDEFFQKQLLAGDGEPARIVAEHRMGYEHVSRTGAAGTSMLDGALRRAPRLARPAVGDWVVLDAHARIRRVLDRRTQLVRRAAGRATEPQVVAANVDRVFVVTSANRDLNPRRVERYLAVIGEGGAEPIVLVNKIDLCGGEAERQAVLATLRLAAPGVTIVLASALGGEGLDALAACCPPGCTVAFVGSSGVGKSSLVNALLADMRQDTGGVRVHDDRGQHTTTRRELLPLPGGGFVIDTPGMRELGLWAGDDGAATAFTDVDELAAACRFSDCRHEREPGCAVRAAVDEGRLEQARLDSLRKLALEQQQQSRRFQRQRSKDARTREKIPKGYR